MRLLQFREIEKDFLRETNLYSTIKRQNFIGIRETLFPAREIFRDYWNLKFALHLGHDLHQFCIIFSSSRVIGAIGEPLQDDFV